MKTLNQEQIDYMLAHGELPESVRLAAERVAVILTQDWCPQWHHMAVYLGDFPERAEIFVLEYNLHPQFHRIMAFKENVFKNHQVPYVRFYADGELVAKTNWISKSSFESMLQPK